MLRSSQLRQFALENYPQNSWNVKDATQLRQVERLQVGASENKKKPDIISDADTALSLTHLSFLLMEGIDIGERLTNFKTFTNEVYADQRESGFERFVSEALNEIGFQVRERGLAMGRDWRGKTSFVSLCCMSSQPSPPPTTPHPTTSPPPARARSLPLPIHARMEGGRQEELCHRHR